MTSEELDARWPLRVKGCIVFRSGLIVHYSSHLRSAMDSLRVIYFRSWQFNVRCHND